MKIAERIIEILKVNILQEDDLEIGIEEDLLTTGTLDSMALIRLVAAIEDTFEIKIQPTDLVIENFMNIKAMETYLLTRISDN